MYRINKAEFYKSIGDIAAYSSSHIPEIAMVGRSNVGKSSLINFVCNSSKLAKVAQTPGKTRLLNFFSINNGAFYLVDLPGYGYAKASKESIKQWNALIESYFNATESLKEVFHLIDARIKPTEEDIQMVRYMVYYNIPFCHIATKCDKLSKAQLHRQLQEIGKTLSVPYTSILPVSAETKSGRDKLLDRIESVLTRDDEVGRAEL